jgi:hypothetical protein
MDLGPLNSFAYIDSYLVNAATTVVAGFDKKAAEIASHHGEPTSLAQAIGDGFEVLGGGLSYALSKENFHDNNPMEIEANHQADITSGLPDGYTPIGSYDSHDSSSVQPAAEDLYAAVDFPVGIDEPVELSTAESAPTDAEFAA